MPELYEPGTASWESRTNHGELVISDLSHPWDDRTRLEKYCPVYAKTNERGGKTFTAYIIGQVMDVECYLDLMDVLYCANESDDFHIYIDSPGGFVSSGSILASLIAATPAKVCTYAIGICASSAALIHSAPKKENIFAEPFGVVMYHMSSHGSQGLSSKIATGAVNQVKYVKERLLKQSLDYGFLLPAEFNSVSAGHNIFIDAKTFNQRKNGEQPDVI